MAKQRRANHRLATPATLSTPMKFAGASSGVLDTSTLPKPPTSLEAWFTDEAAVTAFSVPVKPRG
jgi:hypothetical protein